VPDKHQSRDAIALRGQQHQSNHCAEKEARTHTKSQQGRDARPIGDGGAQVLIQNAIGLGISKDGKDEGAVKTVFDFEKEAIDGALYSCCCFSWLPHVIGAGGIILR